MLGLAIAAVVGSPVVFLFIGFLGVSRKRAEEGREHLEPPVSASTPSTAESAPAIVRSASPKTLPVLDPTQGRMAG